MNYLQKLRTSAKKTGSIACMGLDPVLDALPEGMRTPGWIPDFLYRIFEEMLEQKVFPGAFKPNQGFYLRHDNPGDREFEGSIALAQVMTHIRNMFPDIPIILDFKRGDIAKSSANYAAEGFHSWRADAVTIAPYMGTDSVMPFVEYCKDSPFKKGSPEDLLSNYHSKGVYILNRTSNPGAKDLQNLGVDLPPLEGLEGAVAPLYRVVAGKIIEWAKGYPGVGAVVGATSLEELSALANDYAGKDIPLLIPGVGGQGGKADEVVAMLKEAGYDLSLARINSSSGITHPWAKKGPVPEDYAKVCVEQLHKLNEAIGYKAD